MPCTTGESYVESEPFDEPDQSEQQPEPEQFGGPLTLSVFRALYLGELLALFHTLKMTARMSPVPHLFQFLQFEDFVALAHRSS